MDNITLIVYLWSIWDNLKMLLASISATSCFTAVGLLGAGILFYTINQDASYHKEEEKAQNLKLRNIGVTIIKTYVIKITIPIIVISTITNALLPSKNNLLLVIAASPTAEFIKKSTEEGKLKKLNDLTDKALDKALIYLDEGKQSEPEVDK